MNTEDLTPRDIVEYGSATRAADFVHEGARWVNHVRIDSVPDIYRIIGSFYAGASGMADATTVLSRGLELARESGTLRHAKEGGSIDADLDNARAALAEAEEFAAMLNHALQRAQNNLAWIGHQS